MKWSDKDVTKLHRLKVEGLTHQECADVFGVTRQAIKRAWQRHRNRVIECDDDEVNIKTIEGRVTSLEDLLAVFNIDESEWIVRDWRANTWEQHSVKKGLITLFQVRANLLPANDPRQKALAEFLDATIAKMQAHAPQYDLPPSIAQGAKLTDEPVLWVPSLYDSHIGMRAWGQEVGVPYDSTIAADGYNRAFDELMIPASLYNVDRSLYVVGHDLLHVDQLGEMGRGGQTAAGTPQDVDTRPEKMFDVATDCCVRSIEKLRALGPVDVVIVKGNHDPERVSLLGRVLAAWFRNDDFVHVDHEPNVRKYYRWHSCLFGLTHGKEFKRTRDPLPLILSQEAAAKDWAETRHREWLCGHWHAEHELRYLSKQSTRGVVVRVLPGLTADDAWHHQQGYRHRRAGEALVYGKDTGYRASYSFNLEAA